MTSLDAPDTSYFKVIILAPEFNLADGKSEKDEMLDKYPHLFDSRILKEFHFILPKEKHDCVPFIQVISFQLTFLLN